MTNPSIALSATRKLYYENPLLKSCDATVTEVSDKGVILDQTVAYPEGGGQEGDRGFLVLPGGKCIPFSDTTKGVGRPIFLPDFPSIQVDTPVFHHIDPNTSIANGTPVRVEIDILRRELLSISHSASHLLFLAVGEIRPDAIKWVKGCHITTEYARFDFSVESRFSPDELQSISDIANSLVSRNTDIITYPHKDEPEALYWQTADSIIPCGGTHITNTRLVGPLRVKRKGMGRGRERLSVFFDAPIVDLDKYID